MTLGVLVSLDCEFRTLNNLVPLLTMSLRGEMKVEGYFESTEMMYVG